MKHMSFLKRIFGFGKDSVVSNIIIPSQESRQLADFNSQLCLLLTQDKYVARSDYKPLLDNFASLFSQLNTLHKSKTLKYFCKNKGIDYSLACNLISTYYSLATASTEAEIIKRHNDKFIKTHISLEKKYLNEILSTVDPNIVLDDEQRKVVLSDEDYTLVIAGAGAGKTTTVAAKVKYLVEKQNIKPEQILVISFTNKAVRELRDKINKSLRIKCPVTTFHKTGYAILRRQDTERKSIVTEGFMYNVVNNYLKDNILENPELVDKVILFFGSYFDSPYEGENLNDFFNYITKADFTTLRGNLDEYTEQIIDSRTGKHISIVHETLRSSQEVRIANFLYMNGIDYVYEKPYQYNILRSHKPYTPDFTITQDDKIAYIEHFGITEDGRNNRYTTEQLLKYKNEVNDKVKLHRQHNTTLIYTFSRYKDNKDLLVHLATNLKSHGFELRPRSSREIFDKIVSTEENHYIARLVKLICTFIQNFKTNGYDIDEFYKFRIKSKNERAKLFLTICEQCYLEYTKRLKEKNVVDFEDMINDSARIIREEQIKGAKLDFKYIIVDEYQDISRQRYNLIKELSTLCNAKIVAVGDDWQSIYAYAGSDITLFTEFVKTFGYGKELSITKTYRNAQDVINIAGGFIQKNSKQIKKSLVSPKHITNPVIIQTYTEDVNRKEYEGKGGKYFLVGETVEKIMKEILTENPKSSILLLGRYGFDGYNLTNSSDFQYWDRTGNITSNTFKDTEMEFMTVHRSKGLGFDNVIIINAIDAVYGFPSQVQDDPVLKYVVRGDNDIEYAEERRLFYVALTRTKNRVYIVTPQQRPSPFVRELVQDYRNVVLRGTLDDKQCNGPIDKRCPICGYPLQLRYKKAYGLKLWICSNEPEICGFMTNNLKGKDLSIVKCDQCKDGYLIVKDGTQGVPFLGCTNYKADKCGCNKTMTYVQYVKEKNSI